MEANELTGGVPIYVLNRDAASERLVSVWADAERLGLRLVRVAEEETGDAARARLAAHASAWTKIADGATEFAIVAEDCIDLDERLLPLLDTTALARRFEGPTVVNLDGGPTGGPGPVRIVKHDQPLRSFGAYVIDRATASRLAGLVSPQGTLLSLEEVLANGGVTMLVAAPAPVAGLASGEPDPEEFGTLTRIWRRLRPRRRPHHSRTQGNVGTRQAAPNAPLAKGAYETR